MLEFLNRDNVAYRGGISHYTHEAIGAMLGRSDLGAPTVPQFAYDPYSFQGQLNNAPAGSNYHTGRLSAAMLAAIVIGLGAFYVWTHSVQK